MNKLMAVVLLGMPTALPAATEVVFDAKDPQTSYADGAVTVAYEGERVSAVTFDPAAAGGIVMTGDPLALTACATVSCTSVGAVTLSNDLTSVEAGSLTFLNTGALEQTGTIDLASGSTIAVETVHEPVPCQVTRAQDIMLTQATGEWITLWENTSLGILTNMTGKMAGSVCGAGAVVNSTSWFFENDGVTATCQLQFGSSSMLRGLVYLFRQNGSNVEVQTQYRTFYWPTGTSIPVPKEGEKDFRLRENRWRADYPETETAYNASSLYGTNFVFHCSDTPGSLTKASVTFNGSNATQNCAMRIGNGLSAAEAVMRHPKSFPVNGQVLVRGCANMEYNIAHDTSPVNGQVRGCAFTVEAGGLLHTIDIYAFSATQTDVTLNGGTLQLRGGTPGDDSDTTFHRIYFNDGARLTGWAPRMRSSDALWQVRGSKASVCETGVILWSASSATGGRVTFDVADVTGDDDVDFSVAKSIRLTDTTAGDVWRKASIVKTGAGTMRIDAQLMMTNGVDSLTYLNEGTFLVNGNNRLHPGCSFVLNGGTLAFSENSANACQTVAVGANGGVVAPAAGATIAFADSSAVAWTEGEPLVVACDPEAKQVRFGTSSGALSGAQKRRLRTSDGKRLTLDVDGYVAPVGGMVLIFR